MQVTGMYIDQILVAAMVNDYMPLLMLPVLVLVPAPAMEKLVGCSCSQLVVVADSMVLVMMLQQVVVG
jgi:hypothetical protein